MGCFLLFLFVLGLLSDDPETTANTAQVSGTQKTELLDTAEIETTATAVSKAPTNVTSAPIVENTEISSEPKPQEQYYSVTKVVDGDTLAVDIDGEVETIRLIGINTPETVDPRKTVECFGVEASNKAKELLSGQNVRVERDPSQGERDKYGRLLAYVYLESGVSFNKYMVEEGYAYEYTYNVPYIYQNEYKFAEIFAKENEKGLWAPGVCDLSEPIPTSAPMSIPKEITTEASQTSTNYSCSANIYNCGDFSTHDEAQSVYESCGGVAHDVHGLDRDNDGTSCETLP